MPPVSEDNFRQIARAIFWPPIADGSMGLA
jgi:hypothetical protein